MIERTFDYRIVKKMLPDQQNFVVSSSVIYLIDDFNGIWVVEPDADMSVVHVCMSEKCRGKKSLELCKKVVDWVFSNTDIESLYGVIPKANKAACYNAAHVGMTFSHENKDKRIYKVEKYGWR